jgi:hypothetical protein
MKNFVKSFNNFRKEIYESDGFGTSPFLLEKIDGVFHYFFNMETEDSKTQNGYHLIVGKYSDKEVIEGAKNSYCVLGIDQVSPEIIEDIAIDKTKIPSSNSEKFSLGTNEMSRLMKYVYKCVNSYLEANPKITRIYDQIQDNLEFSGEGTYLEYVKSLAVSQLGSGWSVQQGSSTKTVLISR